MPEIKLHGIIGEGVNTKEVVKAKLESMAGTTEELTVRIDSDGGDVFDGFAIYDAIKAFGGRTKAIVESSAFSIASFIATACDEIEITPNGYFMLHNPMVSVEGADDEELQGHAELLASLKKNMITAYASRMGVSEQEVQEIMRREKYYSAEESLANGLADRVTSYTRASTIRAIDNVPHRVYAALRSDSGDTNQKGEEQMAESTKPVAATVSEIKSAFPKAKSDFIVKCLERSLPMASVAAAAAEEMMEENEALRAQNEELMAKVSAMEEEMAKAKAMEEEEEQAKAEGGEGGMEEEEAKAVAKWRPGAKPIARVASTGGKKQSATTRWRAEVQKYLDAGHPRAKAVASANRHNPGLREQYLAEVNAN